MSYRDTTEHPCVQCGAALPEVIGEASITCRFCNAVQPNPEPLPPGTEVVFGQGMMPKLGRVIACSGPETISLETEERFAVIGPAKTYRLDDLMPVVRAKEGELLPRTIVYAMQSVGWYRTMLVRVDASGMAIVKNHGQAFQGSFFDEKIATDLVRLPLRARDRRRPSTIDLLKERLVTDPFGFLFPKIVVGFIAVTMLFVLVPILYILSLAIFGD